MKSVLFVARVLLLVLFFTGICGAVEHVVVLNEPQPGDGVVEKQFLPVSSAQYPEVLTMLIDAREVEDFYNDFISNRVYFECTPEFYEHEPLTDPTGYQVWVYEPERPGYKDMINGSMRCQWLGSGEGSCYYQVSW